MLLPQYGGLETFHIYSPRCNRCITKRNNSNVLFYVEIYIIGSLSNNKHNTKPNLSLELKVFNHFHNLGYEFKCDGVCVCVFEKTTIKKYIRFVLFWAQYTFISVHMLS